MITIEEFVYLENVKESQSRLLIKEYNGLTFTTPDQFRKFFVDNNIKLETSVSDTKAEKQMLLDKFKSFKSSSDYSTVKKYIQDQVTLKKEIERIQKDPNTKIEDVTNLLTGVNNEPVDPFFNFVIRKILTGSDTGVLPSEDLQQILSNLIKSQTKESYDEVSDVERDEFGRLIDYENLYKNKGRIRVPVLDERFVLNDFRYKIDTSFGSLSDAISSEENILRKAADAIQTEGTTDNFLSNLKNLINQDSTSIAGLTAKIESLQEIINAKNDLIEDQIDATNRIDESINALALDSSIKSGEIQAKDDTIKELNTKIDTTISGLEQKVSKQLQDTNAAFENLSKKLEEQSAKQLSAFESAVSGLAKAVTPPTPAPAPENPAKEIINQINTEWDKMTVISEQSYSKFSEILDILGVTNKPSKYTYVYVPPAKGNIYNPSEEIKQHLTWNNQYKSQYKNLVNQITDKTKATNILNNVKSILTDASSINNTGLYDTVVDSINGWSTDFGKSRGIGANAIKKIAVEVGATWIPHDDYSNKSADAAKVASSIKSKLTRNTNQLLTVTQILSEIQTQSGW